MAFFATNKKTNRDQTLDHLVVVDNLVLGQYCVFYNPGSSVFTDNGFVVVNQADATKAVKFNNAGATTGTLETIALSQTANRVFTLPDITGTAITDAGTQTLTGSKTFNSALITPNTTAGYTYSGTVDTAGSFAYPAGTTLALIPTGHRTFTGKVGRMAFINVTSIAHNGGTDTLTIVDTQAGSGGVAFIELPSIANGSSLVISGIVWTQGVSVAITVTNYSSTTDTGTISINFSFISFN